MKKKIITALTALMVLSMGTTVFAATSPVAGVPGASAVSKVTAADGSSVTVADVVESEVKDAAEAYETANTTTKETTTLLAVVDVTATVNTAITFEVAGVKAGDDITVLHWDGTKWESDSVKNVKVADGKVTATFTKLSPIAIVKSELTQEGKNDQAFAAWVWANMQAGSNNAAATTTPTSPKTFDATLGLMAMAALCGAGATICGKKSR